MLNHVFDYNLWNILKYVFKMSKSYRTMCSKYIYRSRPSSQHNWGEGGHLGVN